MMSRPLADQDLTTDCCLTLSEDKRDGQWLIPHVAGSSCLKLSRQIGIYINSSEC